MIRILFTVVLIIVYCAPALWAQTLRALHFPSRQLGYGVGYDGLMIKTADGGQTWTRLNSPVGTSLLGVEFIDNSTGFAVGDHLVILKTTDGGKTWTKKTCTECSGITLNVSLIDVAVCGEKMAFAAGGYGTLVYTEDGGDTWHQVNYEDQNGLNCIECFGDRGLRTSGKSVNMFYWRLGGSVVELTGDPDIHIAKFHFIDQKRGIGAGPDGYTYATNDGGRNWHTFNVGDPVFMRTVYYKDGFSYCAGNRPAVFVSQNLGQKWYNVPLNMPKGAQTVFHITSNGSALFAAGEGGVLFRSTTKGKTWSRIPY